MFHFIKHMFDIPNTREYSEALYECEEEIKKSMDR